MTIEKIKNNIDSKKRNTGLKNKIIRLLTEKDNTPGNKSSEQCL